MKLVFGLFLIVISMFGGVVGTVVNSQPAYAVPETENVEQETDESPKVMQKVAEKIDCKASLGAIGWFVCPAMDKIAAAVDTLYRWFEDVLVINPVAAEDGSPIYEVWKYCRGITNIVFIIFLLIVIYSQITGLGISNYGIKRALPKLIIAAVLMNLSFLICLLLVDLSNAIGNGLRGVFMAISNSALLGGAESGVNVSTAGFYGTLGGGVAIALAGGVIAFETGAIWMLIPLLLGAFVSAFAGLFAIALRQAVVALLTMISPLAMVAYILPNTENLFKKWKDLLIRMLVFYPMFSLLFGASQLAGFAIIMSAKNSFILMLGMAVQVFPLFFSWKLMQMSGTFLGDINAKIRGLAATPLAANRAWADSHRQLTKQRQLASKRAYTPSLKVMQILSDRKVAREAKIDEYAAEVKERGLASRARRKYKRGDVYGTLSREGRDAYERQARIMEYQHVSMRDKNNFDKGFGHTAKEGTALRRKLDALDIRNVEAADSLFAEQERGEFIEYENAKGRHKRMEDAINAHFDEENKGKSTYKMHDIKDRAAAISRYNAMRQIMDERFVDDETVARDTQLVAAGAAQAYDTKSKIVMSKYQKYFELRPPTRDIELRLGEMTKLSKTALANGDKVADYIDAVIPGLRILNERGDTDLIKEQLDNILDKNIGGGVYLGTHASQALASFLMFDVKDGDPFLRRFGKYLNLETARAFNANDRQMMSVTYDEYIKGYHDGEPITDDNPTGRMYAKRGMRQLIEGTSLDNIERTAFSSLDASLKKAYGFKKGMSADEWDVDGYLKKREEIQTSFEPAFLSAGLKWLSGSEAINSAVKFWMGYELKPKIDEDGKLVTDENGDLEYDLTPVWEDEKSGFRGREDEIREYYRRKTSDYFKDQTTGQILGMRTDFRDATMEHLVDAYLSEDSEEGRSDEKKARFEQEKADIQTRYSDKTPEEAKKLRSRDLKKLKMELAGRQVRKILGPTGKLKQIYRTRTSGTAINAKDWLRRWVSLDDEDSLREEMNHYDEEIKKVKNVRVEEERKGADSEMEEDFSDSIYDSPDRERFVSEMSSLKDSLMDARPEEFFEGTRSQLEDWFGRNAFIVQAYERYYRRERSSADNQELYRFLKELLGDSSNYPDA